jgi:Kef-type K+ transport system membrane component KefB
VQFESLTETSSKTLQVMLFWTLMTKFFNNQIVRMFIRDGELLFICALAYCYGSFGTCYIIGFSPMAGAYMAGTHHAIMIWCYSMRAP